MDKKELELYRFMKAALESGATIKMTEKGKGGLFVRGKKLTDKDLLECITDPEPKTKADCIRTMTDEDLAYLLVHSPFMTEKNALNWLKQEVER